jgi:predicted phosphodiesterase
MNTVLVIPDLHVPFHHQDALKFLAAVKKKFKPTEVINLGDFEDWHSINMHDHDPDGLSAGAELQKLREEAKPFFKLFPKMKICTSNHGSLPLRRAYKFGLPKELIKSYKDILKAPKGWQWADEFEIDGIIYEHGESFTGQQGAIKSANANMQSTVIGHIHAFAGIQYSANQKHLIFGFNVGCLINNSSYAFAYGKKFKAKPILGCGIIENGIPTFIPMILTKKNRWTGKL